MMWVTLLWLNLGASTLVYCELSSSFEGLKYVLLWCMTPLKEIMKKGRCFGMTWTELLDNIDDEYRLCVVGLNG